VKTPKQVFVTSLLMLELSITRVRKRPKELIPLRRRRLRLVDAARKQADED